VGRACVQDPRWRALTESAKDLILKLLQPDPKNRYTAKQARLRSALLLTLVQRLLHAALCICADGQQSSGGLACALVPVLCLVQNPVTACTPSMSCIKRFL
jgi:serine/threonine protein kinase